MSADHSEETPHAHDQAAEVAHARHHFRENVKFFACFLGIILLTVFAFNINFGSWNTVAVLVLAALRSGLIAFFMASMFNPFSFVTRTFIFSAIFLAAMIFLSLWDSSVKGIGDPIKDRNPPPQSHVP
jgi:hypothetical protein